MTGRKARNPQDFLAGEHDGQGVAELFRHLPVDEHVGDFGSSGSAERPVAIPFGPTAPAEGFDGGPQVDFGSVRNAAG
jgi:hypothetical protein